MFQKIAIVLIVQLAMVSNCSAQKNQTFLISETLLPYITRERIESAEKLPLLILLHGYGSNEYDIFSFSSQIPKSWIVVSVRAPFMLSENSYRWYDAKMVNGKIVINIDEAEKSIKKLFLLITEITRKYNADSKKVIIAGFSQGANMAQSIGIGEPNLVAGFGAFSGRFVDELNPNLSKSKAIKYPKAFISHGSEDSLLPKTYAAENISKLSELGIQITYCEDTNGHSISSKQWKEFSIWLLNFNKNNEK